MDLPVYKAVINTDINSNLEVDFIALVDKPAIEKNFIAFNDRLKFAVNEEKRVIQGPAMIAEMPIYRRDNKLGEYYIIFDKATIQDIVEKFSAKGFMTNFNLFHNEDAKLSDITIFNSFISNADLGIMPLKGFEDVNDGSWFISAKVNNDDVWQKIKQGEIRGFSVEGWFNYVPVLEAKKYTPEQAEQLIKDILSNTIF